MSPTRLSFSQKVGEMLRAKSNCLGNLMQVTGPNRKLIFKYFWAATTKATNMKFEIGQNSGKTEMEILRAARRAKDIVFVHMRTVNVCGIKGDWNDLIL